MQKSTCTLIVPGKIDTEEYIAYNTRTQALLVINQQIKNALDALPDTALFNDNQEILGALHEHGIVVADDNEERALIENYFYQMEHKVDLHDFEIMLLTTLDCNFACAYCFEEGAKTKQYLTHETSEHIVDWIQFKVLQNGYKKINIVFYGGEPLLNKKPIYSISRALQSWGATHNVAYSFGMVTNGYLFNEEEVDEWIDLGFKHVQITLDGVQNFHDKRRTLMDGSGTFEKILTNLHFLIQRDLKVSVSCNYDSENIEGVIQLLDFLNDEGILRKLDDVAFSPILPRLGPKHNPRAVELTHCLKRYDTEYFEMNMRLRTEAAERGLPIPHGLGYTGCMLVSRDNGVMIDPGGLLYKCPTMVGYPEYSVGNVTEHTYNKHNEEFASIHAWKKCDRDCPYIPICNGGCRFMALANSGDLHSLWCERANLDRMAPELIRLDYEKKCCQPV